MTAVRAPIDGREAGRCVMCCFTAPPLAAMVLLFGVAMTTS